MIVLRNKTKLMKVYNLDRHHGTIKTFPEIRALANGASVGQRVKRKLPDSITFLAGETRSKWKDKPLPDSLLTCPDIAAALTRGELVQVKVIVDRSQLHGAAPVVQQESPAVVASAPTVSDDSEEPSLGSNPRRSGGKKSSKKSDQTGTK